MLEKLTSDDGDNDSSDYDDDHDNDDGKGSDWVRSEFSPDDNCTVDGVGGFILLCILDCDDEYKRDNDGNDNRDDLRLGAGVGGIYLFVKTLTLK